MMMTSKQGLEVSALTSFSWEMTHSEKNVPQTKPHMTYPIKGLLQCNNLQAEGLVFNIGEATFC